MREQEREIQFKLYVYVYLSLFLASSNSLSYCVIAHDRMCVGEQGRKIEFKIYLYVYLHTLSCVPSIAIPIARILSVCVCLSLTRMTECV